MGGYRQCKRWAPKRRLNMSRSIDHDQGARGGVQVLQ